MLLNETLLTGKMKISLSPYSCWYKNRTEKGGGGVATAVSQQYKDSAVGAGEGQGEDEYLIMYQFNLRTPGLGCFLETYIPKTKHPYYTPAW